MLSSRNAKIIGQLLRRINGSVVALRVITVRSQKGWEGSFDKSQQVVNDFTELMRKEGVSFEVRVETSNKVTETICQVAKEEDVGLVIIGGSGRSKFVNRFFGGSTERVTALLDCPVVVLPGP